MTCDSERSGIASSLTRWIEYRAPRNAISTPNRTRNRLRAQNSMIFSTMARLLLPRPGDGVLAVAGHLAHALVLDLARTALLVLFGIPGLVEIAVAGRWG